jgi:CRP-like cAMP-binding protein
MAKGNLLENIFSTLNFSEQEKETVIGSFEKVTFKKNEFLFKQGKVLNHYYFLEKGFIRSFTYDYDGNEVTTNFYAETEIVIDWTSFMLRVPTQENFQANTDCICWKLSYNDFQNLFNTIEKFRESGRARFANSYFKLKKNHLSMISLTAKDRYLLLLNEHPEIIQHSSLKHIATYLGITDTSLSRIRKEI